MENLEKSLKWETAISPYGNLLHKYHKCCIKSQTLLLILVPYIDGNLDRFVFLYFMCSTMFQRIFGHEKLHHSHVFVKKWMNPA